MATIKSSIESIHTSLREEMTTRKRKLDANLEEEIGVLKRRMEERKREMEERRRKSIEEFDADAKRMIRTYRTAKHLLAEEYASRTNAINTAESLIANIYSAQDVVCMDNLVNGAPSTDSKTLKNALSRCKETEYIAEKALFKCGRKNEFRVLGETNRTQGEMYVVKVAQALCKYGLHQQWTLLGKLFKLGIFRDFDATTIGTWDVGSGYAHILAYATSLLI